MIKLFDVAVVKEIEPKGALSLSTPLGDLNLEVIMDNSKLSKILPQVSGEVSPNASIYAWVLKDIQIELLKVDIKPALSPPMKVSRCIAFLWRFRNLSKRIDLQFSCRLSFKGKKLEGEPESGEALIAQSWGDANARITIGTEDDELLLARAEYQKWLPLRMSKENLIIPEIIEYLDDGIQVSFPPFLENEEGQVQFIIAWIEAEKYEDYWTWQAVDVPYKNILESI